MVRMEHRTVWHTFAERFKTFAKFAGTAIAGIVVFLLVLIGFHGRLIDNIYKNVEDINDGEMPITVTSYPSGPEVVGIIGGSGKGLNCSLPLRVVDLFFDASRDPATGNRHLVRQRFRQACVFHDLCYRHGLATYGYSQNDCDRILQNQAFRLCKYIRNAESKTDAERCQLDSKKLLAGVSLGGYGSYRAWDLSTFFEFDSDPIRAVNEFSFSRVVDHPFKSVDPTKYHDEADQVVLTFTNRRSNLTIRCTTCNKGKTILDWSDQPNGVSAELKSVGLDKRPEALVPGELSYSDTQPLWLPPRRDHAAPHLVVDGAGKDHLIWMSRISVENTGACIASADAAELLTYTMPKRDSCHRGAFSPLNLVQAEMHASSPLPLVLPEANAGEDILATGLTPQLDTEHNLYLCLWSERIRAQDAGGDESVCTLLDDKRIKEGKGIGAFQNFAVVRPGQQIFFSRDVALESGSNRFAELTQRIVGNIHSANGSAVVVNVSPPSVGVSSPGIVTIKKIARFAISDDFDPMMPITRNKNDLKFLSLLASDTRTDIYQTDFDDNPPAPQKISVTMDGKPLELDGSWGLRPALIVQSKESPQKTQLILSRGAVESTGNDFVDTVQLQALAMERELSDVHGPFSITRGVACTVTYQFEKPLPNRACLRAFEPRRPMRSSPAAMMRASQLVVGRFGGSGGLGLAFADKCLEDPIVLVPGDPAQRDFAVTTATAQGQEKRVTREVHCEALSSHQRISQPMSTRIAP